MSANRNRKKLLVSFAAAALLAGGAFYTLDGRADSSPPSAPAVEGRTLVAPALVEARGDRVELAFEGSGQLTEILVDEGDRVKAGQVLARLDDRIARAQVAKAQAALEAAVARRDLAVRGPRRDEVRAAEAEADAAKAQAWERGVNKKRAEDLLAANADAIPVAEVDAARGTSQASDAQARAADARLALLKKGSRREVIAEAEAAVAIAQAELDAAKTLLSQTELKAPADGVVLRRMHEVGEHVTHMPPTTVLVVADVDHLELRAEIDEADVAKLGLGQTGYATADAYGDKRFAGHVTLVVGELGRKTQRLDDPKAKVDTRVQEVIFTLDEPAALPLGLRMDVHLDPAAPKAAVK
jgi:multidrug resistance efflux pump